MDNRTKGQLIMGFGIKLIAIGLALWVGVTAATVVSSLFDSVATVLEEVNALR